MINDSCFSCNVFGCVNDIPDCKEYLMLVIGDLMSMEHRFNGTDGWKTGVLSQYHSIHLISHVDWPGIECGPPQWEAGNLLLEPWYGPPVTVLVARIRPKHLIFQPNKLWFLWCSYCYRVWTLQEGKTRVHSSCRALQRWPKSGVCCCRLHKILRHLWCCGCEGISHIQVLPLLHQGN